MNNKKNILIISFVTLLLALSVSGGALAAGVGGDDSKVVAGVLFSSGSYSIVGDLDISDDAIFGGAITQYTGSNTLYNVSLSYLMGERSGVDYYVQGAISGDLSNSNNGIVPSVGIYGRSGQDSLELASKLMVSLSNSQVYFDWQIGGDYWLNHRFGIRGFVSGSSLDGGTNVGMGVTVRL